MANIVKVEYDSESLVTKIIFNGEEFDTSRIENKKMEEWIYPFLIKGIRWKGFFNEIKEYNGNSDNFIVKFDGSEKYFKLLEKSLEGSNARIISSDNNVVILYKKEPLSTIITVNGKAFDTSRLAGRKIDEWVLPFEISETKWDGIFSELSNFIGTDDYSIQFAGEQEDMLELVNNAPDTVNISIKANVPKKMPSPAINSEQLQKMSSTVKGAVGNITSSEQYQKATETVKGAAKKVDESVSGIVDNITSSERYQKIMENENVQKIKSNSVVVKISDFWKSLSKPVKYGICAGVILIVVGSVIISVSGSPQSKMANKYIDSVEDQDVDELLDCVPDEFEKNIMEYYKLDEEGLKLAIEKKFGDDKDGSVWKNVKVVYDETVTNLKDYNGNEELVSDLSFELDNKYVWGDWGDADLYQEYYIQELSMDIKTEDDENWENNGVLCVKCHDGEWYCFHAMKAVQDAAWVYAPEINGY